jgi:hypothetical protein
LLDEQNAIAQLSAAQHALEEARTITDVMGLHAMASAVEVLARQARMGTAAINTAQEVKLLCVRKLADVVDAGQDSGEIAAPGRPENGPQSGPLPATYADLGLTKRWVDEARLIRDTFTDDQIRGLVADATRRDQEVAKYRLLRDGRYARAARERARHDLEDSERLRVLPPTMDIRLGDFTQVLADVRGVDAIITDPPYPQEHLHLYAELAEWADKVLSADGVLVVMTGHMYLPEVFRLMSGWRPYRWTCAYLTPGAHNTVHARRVMQGWKPLIVYGGGPRFHDVFRSPGDDKQQHHWGQNLDAFTQVVQTFSRPGQLVADPFLGGGTTAAACLHTDRAFIGCDVDAEAVETTRQRLLWEESPT